eukprot:scaffold106667_cov31-Tisochrysis_lutea.AAC.5
MSRGSRAARAASADRHGALSIQASHRATHRCLPPAARANLRVDQAARSAARVQQPASPVPAPPPPPRAPASPRA